MSDIGKFEESFERILFSNESLEDLEDELEEVYEQGGLETLSHVYGLNERVNQFEELFQAYREFYSVKDFRDGSRMKDRKLQNLMEAYRDYFGPGANERWNEGVDVAKTISPAANFDGPLDREDFYSVISGSYEQLE